MLVGTEALRLQIFLFTHIIVWQSYYKPSYGFNLIQTNFISAVIKSKAKEKLPNYPRV